MLAIAWVARSTITLALILGYLGAGAAAGVRLARRGHALGLIASAVVAWPLLTGVLLGPPQPAVALRRPIAGPFASRIAQGLASLNASLADARGDSPIELASPTQLASLELALRLADERIAGVDRLITELEPGSPAPTPEYEHARNASLARLRGAREHAAAELEQVLAMLLSVRVQIGLTTLAGPATVAPVRERLAELEARVAALAELSSFDESRPSLPTEAC